jgi:hypothetical protein
VLYGNGAGRTVSLTTINTQGEYERIEFAFDSALHTYAHTVRALDSGEHRVAVLEKGVVASIETDGELSITVPKTGEQRIVQDTGVDTTLRLARRGDTVLYIKNGAVWSLTMK